MSDDASPAPGRPPHGDPGLQPERTVMAWTRTTVSLAIVSAVLLRWAWVYGAVGFVLVVVLWGVAVGILFTQRHRYRERVGGLVADRAEPKVGAVLTLTAAVLLLGAGALLLVLAP